MENINFGVYLKKLRKERRLSIRELAKLSDVSHAYISQIETSDKIPSPEIINKISKVLNVPLEEMMVRAGHIDTDTIYTVIEYFNKQIEEKRRMVEFVQAQRSILIQSINEDFANNLDITEKQKELKELDIQANTLTHQLIALGDLAKSTNKKLSESAEDVLTETEVDNIATQDDSNEFITIKFNIPKTKVEIDGPVQIEVQLTQNEALENFFNVENLLSISKYVNYNGKKISQDDKTKILDCIKSIMN